MSKTMNYHNVKFTAAYGTSKQLPPSKRAEVSFVGRSNVGKSSLMNKLFNRKKLAKVSATPGKTSTINFFEAEWADFVDLPGYGFAQVSKSEKARWREMIEGYYNQDREILLRGLAHRHSPPRNCARREYDRVLDCRRAAVHDCMHESRQTFEEQVRAVNCRAAPPAGLLAR